MKADKISENTYSLNDLYYDTQLFNKIAGKSNDTSLADIKKQVALIQEELDEIKQGIAELDPVKVLDGAVDTAVTLFGLMDQLERMNMNVSLAMGVTAENNLSKFVDPDNTPVIENTYRKHGDIANGYLVEVDHVGYIVFKHKDTNKVLKPSNFKPNDLSPFVPKDFKFYE